MQDASCDNADCRCPVFKPTYTITSLGTLGGYSSPPQDSSRGQAINDLGQVAGRSYGPKGQHAFLWNNGVMTDLGTFEPDAEYSSGRGMNNLSHVVGTSYDPQRAVLWRDGEIYDLGSLNSTSGAYAINDSRQAVGYSFVTGTDSHAVLWQDGQIIDLASTLGIPIREAVDINESGQIVGDSYLIEPDGTVVELGTLGVSPAQAAAINDLGQVVGYAYAETAGSFAKQAVLQTTNEITNLGALGQYTSSGASDINNDGQIIGGGSGPKPWCGSPFLYDPESGMRRFRHLIPPDTGWAGLRAREINNAGQITGTGALNGETRAFLMTPIPPQGPIPTVSQWGLATMCLLLLCAASVLLRTRRTRVG